MEYFIHLSHPRYINYMNSPGPMKMLNTQEIETRNSARCFLRPPLESVKSVHAVFSYCRFSGTVCCGCSPGKGLSADRPCTKWVRTLGKQLCYYVRNHKVSFSMVLKYYIPLKLEIYEHDLFLMLQIHISSSWKCIDYNGCHRFFCVFFPFY